MKPMLAAKADLSKLRYPLLISPKLDGIRCLVKDGVALSRSLKPIPNEYVQDWIGRRSDELNGFDGELIVGRPTAPDVYNVTQSAVMSKSGRPNFRYILFDRWDMPGVAYEYRDPRNWFDKNWFDENWFDERKDRARPVLTLTIMGQYELEFYENLFLTRGYEGVMIRDPAAPYKYGRSTVKEGSLLKLKRLEDSEAIITGFQEMMHNANESTTDNLGRTKRSSAKAGLVPTGTLGSFVVRDIYSGAEFTCGTGLSAEQRRSYWAGRDGLVGKIIKYRYLPVGVKEAPRHPVFLGFRDERDM